METFVHMCIQAHKHRQTDRHMEGEEERRWQRIGPSHFSPPSFLDMDTCLHEIAVQMPSTPTSPDGGGVQRAAHGAQKSRLQTPDGLE